MSNKQTQRGLTPERSEQEVYAQIVADVKAKAAKEAPGKMTGDQVSHEIQRRWAKYKGRPFDTPKPDGPGGVGSTAASAPPGERAVGPIKQVEGPQKLQTPEVERPDED